MFQELLNSIGIDETFVDVSNIVCHKHSNTLTMDIDVKKLINYSDVLRIKNMLENKLKMNVELNIHFSCFSEILSEDKVLFLKDFILNFCLLLKEDEIDLKFYKGRYVLNFFESQQQLLCQKGHWDLITKQFKNLFNEDIPIDINVTKEKKIVLNSTDEISRSTKKYVPKKKTEENMIFGRRNASEEKNIDDIEFGKVKVTGKVFGLEKRELSKVEKTIITFSITDYTNSVNCKLFVSSKDENEIDIKDEVFVTVYGDYTLDDYTGGALINVKGIEEAKDPFEREDNCKDGKRVELHLHTQMSSMDSVLDIKKAIELAKKWGHKAIAVTDHGVVQSFPKAYDTAKKNDIKIIYGVEGYLFDDKNQYVYNCDDRPIDGEIVVFDIETTGLDFHTEAITEIGAVKIRNFEIVDSFHTMVNPLKPIPPKITQITGITNEMVKDAPKINEALDSFYDFCKDSILCAHNAKFDTGFIYYYDLENRFKMPVIDTLAVSRRLLPTLRNHKLDTLVKHFGIVLSNHHRADHDAKATGELLIKLLEMYREKGLSTLNEINNWSIKDSDMQGSDVNHVILLAKDKKGLFNLYKLISISHLSYFYKKPRIPKSVLKANREGLLIGSACEQGELYRAILNKKNDNQLKNIVEFYDYLEIQPNGNNMFLLNSGLVKSIDDLNAINKKICALGEKYNKPVVATCDAHFIEERDQIYRKILLAGQGFKDFDQDTPLYFRTTDEMLKEFSYLGEQKAKEVVIDNTNIIADMCNVEKPFPDDKTYTPKIEGAEEEMTRLTMTRAYELYGEKIPDIIQKRIDKELNSINGYGFAVLYLIAQKLVKKSMDDGYLVGSRGSVGSSFVAYLSGITEVNPMPPHYLCKNCKTVYFDVDKDKYPCGKDLPDRVCEKCNTPLYKDGYDIPFEVFLGFEGDKVPDIDLNFSGVYQPTAHKYIEELFGQGHVFRAGTVSELKDKTAYGFVKNYLKEQDIKACDAEVNRLVAGCVGVKRTTGQHPGGIVIVPKDFEVYDFTPIQYPADSKDKGVITTHFDFNSMHDILVKVDALGHDDPTMLRVLQDVTGIDPKDIPLDDKDTMSIFSSTKALGINEEDINSKVGTFGIPEFGTKFVRQMLIETLPKTMAELVRISGLSHGTDVWIGNAQDLIKNGTCTLRDAICTRDDIMNYLINMGVPDKISFEIMELVRKGKGKKLSEKHLEEMKKANVPEWFLDSCRKIGYMFPKAHAAAYVMMAFRIAWYKVHKPEYYYAAYLSRNIDDFDCSMTFGGLEAIEYKLQEFENKSGLSVKDKSEVSILEIILEMNKRGYTLLPVDIMKSDASSFTVEDKKVRMPFRAIAGLGDAVANAIVEERKKKPFLSIEDLRQRTKLNKTVIDFMKELGCFEGMSDSNQLSIF